MKIQDSIRLCIRDYEAKEHDSAMLHVCNAVDGMANMLYRDGDDKRKFTSFVKANYDIISAVSFPSLFFQKCEFPFRDSTIQDYRNKYLSQLIYVVHRCNHCHGKEIPEGYELIFDDQPDDITSFEQEDNFPDISCDFSYKDGAIRINAKVIPALAMAVILQPINWEKSNIKELNKCYIDSCVLGKLGINEWWGRERDFKRELEKAGFPNKYDRQAVITQIGDDNRISGIEIWHESEFRQY